MNRSLFTAVALTTLFTAAGLSSPTATTAQDNILAEMYGRGVHAYYAGRYSEAYQHLSTAINGGIQDPRAYYFRGIVASDQGRVYEAEADWREGAKLEATGSTNIHVGRSLSRFQGSARLKLEEIRQAARIDALSGTTTRTDIRMREIAQAQPPRAGEVAPPPVPASSKPITAPSKAVTAGAPNPFASDANLAGGRPTIENDDALADAMNDPFKDDGAPAALGAGPAADAPVNDPFGGAAPAGDPFGGGADPAADPFGGGASDAGAPMSDPFGADPFGN